MLGGGCHHAWGRLWGAKGQEAGDSLAAMLVHGVASKTSRRWAGMLQRLCLLAIGSKGQSKGEVLSHYLLQQAREGASASTMWGTIAAVRAAEDLGWILQTLTLIHRQLAKVGGAVSVLHNPPPVRGKNFPLYGPLCGADLFG